MSRRDPVFGSLTFGESVFGYYDPLVLDSVTWDSPITISIESDSPITTSITLGDT